jgi:MscS family membrane protein
VTISVGVLVVLRYFGVNLTAALAELGVGGIAVALAGPKTFENGIRDFPSSSTRVWAWAIS